MVRLSKVTRIRARCPKKTKSPAPKTGAKKDNLKMGYKPHPNALAGAEAQMAYIPKVK